eukprot:11157173-Lingulodinium_polyedra.AAC.1
MSSAGGPWGSGGTRCRADRRLHVLATWPWPWLPLACFCRSPSLPPWPSGVSKASTGSLSCCCWTAATSSWARPPSPSCFG